MNAAPSRITSMKKPGRAAKTRQIIGRRLTSIPRPICPFASKKMQSVIRSGPPIFIRPWQTWLLKPAMRACCKALLKLYESATSRRMYITGGLGSAAANEGFTWDYDLPNESAYSETCAAIGLFLWSHRMLQLDLDGRYADVMERCLYNNILASTSLSGDRYFYVNPLEVQRQPPGLMRLKHLAAGHRQEWYDCACCPPNIAACLPLWAAFSTPRTQMSWSFTTTLPAAFRPGLEM
jgi:hypothetical protein